MLNASFPGRSLVRAAVLIPWAIPTIVSAKMWGWMMHDQFGILNHMLMGLGLISSPLAWTASPDLALTAVIMVDVWKTTPFMALLILAALQMLPTDCYEAARVDGIHPVRVFFKVTLPLIKPALMVAVIFRLLDALRIFDLIYVLTVSYTHLDVYKRQIPPPSGWPSTSNCWRRARPTSTCFRSTWCGPAPWAITSSIWPRSPRTR